MKSFCLILLIGLFQLIPNLYVYGGPGCGNPNYNGLDYPICDCPPCPGDPFNPYNGNESRKIQELQIWGGVGEHQLTWIRYGNSRYANLKNIFGSAHNWNFSYNYNMADQGVNSNGQAQLYIHYPEGGSNIFTQDTNDPSIWLSLPGVNKRIFQKGNNFYLQMADGFRYRFEKLSSSPGRYYYQLQEFKDNYQNLYTLTYDRNKRLVRITEPAGRYLQITYAALSNNTVITKVTGSDGRSVQYNYDIYNDGILNSVRLVSASYGDGTQAMYTYSQSVPGARFILEHAIDPRYTGKNGNMIFKYNNAVASGFISEERNGVTGELMVTLTTSVNHRRVCYANGRIEHYLMPDSLMGRLKEYTDGLGRKKVFDFDLGAGGNGFMKSEKDELGRVTNYVRTIYGNPLEITYPDGSKESWTRDGLARELTHTDELGRVTIYDRDAMHRVTKVTYPDGTNEQYTYNNFGQVLTHTLKNGGTETYTYDSRGLKTSMTDALGNVTAYTYDSADRLASVTEARNNTTSYEYNERGLLTKLINADNSFQAYTYDNFGNRLTNTNELGNTWTSIYDEFKRLKSSKDPLNRITKYDYGLTGVCACQHDNNTPTLITLPSGRMTKMEYDVEWKLLRRTEGAGTADAATTSYEYDLTGKLVVMIDPRGKSLKYEYDSQDRKIATIDPLGYKTQQTYDLAGNMLKIIRPDNGFSMCVYDNMNRITQITDPKGQVTIREYDAEGNIVKLIDAKNNSYRFEYDLLNRKTRMIYPDSSFERYKYDPVGNVNAYVSRSGASRIYSYDNRNRQIFSDWSDTTPDIGTTYDSASRILTMSSNISSLSYIYNDANQLTGETQNIAGNTGGKTISYNYNEDGLRDKLFYPGGTVLNYNYSGRNQLSSIVNNGAAIVNYRYDMNGNRTNKALQNGTATSYMYDDANHLLSLNNERAGVSFARFDYGYDNVDRRVFVQRDGDRGDVYSYDAVDQITKVLYDATDPGGTATGSSRNVLYHWDKVGNRDSVTDNGIAVKYETNNLNQYTNVGNNAFAYNPSGDLKNLSGWSYTYDAQDRLIKAEKRSTIITFDYDPFNRCVKRAISNGATNFFYYDNWNLIEEHNTNEMLVNTYTLGAQIDEILLKRSSGSKTLIYYHYDAVGSVTHLTHTLGSVVEKYSYDVFGKATIKNGSGTLLANSGFGNRFMFTGREYIKELNLYDYRNRVYFPEHGRFNQCDLIGFNGEDINLYRYVRNTPLNLMDPLGLITCTPKLISGSNTFSPITNLRTWRMHLFFRSWVNLYDNSYEMGIRGYAGAFPFNWDVRDKLESTGSITCECVSDDICRITVIPTQSNRTNSILTLSILASVTYRSDDEADVSFSAGAANGGGGGAGGGIGPYSASIQFPNSSLSDAGNIATAKWRCIKSE
jgi:RHS repeat-associated protein